MVESEFSKMEGTSSSRIEDEKRDVALNELLQGQCDLSVPSAVLCIPASYEHSFSHSEMKVLREQIANQITEEIEALKVAREEASAAIKTMAAQMQARISSIATSFFIASNLFFFFGISRHLDRQRNANAWRRVKRTKKTKHLTCPARRSNATDEASLPNSCKQLVCSP
jgi:hypothetical protein